MNPDHSCLRLCLCLRLCVSEWAKFKCYCCCCCSVRIFGRLRSYAGTPCQLVTGVMCYEYASIAIWLTLGLCRSFICIRLRRRGVRKDQHSGLEDQVGLRGLVVCLHLSKQHAAVPLLWNSGAVVLWLLGKVLWPPEFTRQQSSTAGQSLYEIL